MLEGEHKLCQNRNEIVQVGLFKYRLTNTMEQHLQCTLISTIRKNEQLKPLHLLLNS